MTSGPDLFGRYAFPPNVLGYCGPSDSGLTEGLVSADAATEVARVVRQFEGAWPYLELIGGCTGREPLDRAVVEAYWLGNSLLDDIDMLTWGNSVDERFRHRAGDAWGTISDGIVSGRPNHAFHVFCVYPWVGLLRSGYADHALEVIDRCRIRWGVVVGRSGRELVVESRPLTWDGNRLDLGPIRRETVSQSMYKPSVDVDDTVALHWDYVCEGIGPRQLLNLKTQTALHLRIANQPTKELSLALES